MITRTLSRAALPLLAMGLVASRASAVTLEQKWRAGETLNYDLSMQGDATFQTDAQGFPLAGVPVPIKLKGTGSVLMTVTEVDENGAGTIAPRLDPFTLRADTFGQKFETVLKADKTELLWNGRAAWTGPNRAFGTLKISRLGKIEGVAPAKPAQAAATETQPDANAKPRSNPFDPMLADMILRALPAAWPGRDIPEGGTWSAEFPRFLAQAEGGRTNPQLGKFTFTLGPQETVGGRAAYRVQLVGALRYEEVVDPNAAKPDAAKGRLQNASQKVSGNLWFDPELGQIVRAELDLQASGKGNAPAGQNARRVGPEAALDFTGTLQMQLKSVTQADN